MLFYTDYLESIIYPVLWLFRDIATSQHSKTIMKLHRDAWFVFNLKQSDQVNTLILSNFVEYQVNSDFSIPYTLKHMNNNNIAGKRV